MSRVQNVQLLSDLKYKETVVQVFEIESLLKEHETKKNNDQSIQNAADALKKLWSYKSNAESIVYLQEVFNDLGLKGKVYIKNIKGKPYAILKGLPGSRVVLNNGRYLPNNPILVRMGVGKVGVKAKMRSGTAFTLVLYVGIDIANYILKEDSTIGELFGSIISDVSKVLISTALGTAAGMLAAGSVAAVGAIAAGPIVIAIGVAFLAGMALDALDEKYGLTQTLIKKLDEIAQNITASVEEAESTFARFLNEVEREIIWHVSGGRLLY